MRFILNKLAHGRFAFRSVNSTQYKYIPSNILELTLVEYLVFMAE